MQYKKHDFKLVYRHFNTMDLSAVTNTMTETYFTPEGSDTTPVGGEAFAVEEAVKYLLSMAKRANMVVTINNLADPVKGMGGYIPMVEIRPDYKVVRATMAEIQRRKEVAKSNTYEPLSAGRAIYDTEASTPPFLRAFKPNPDNLGAMAYDPPPTGVLSQLTNRDSHSDKPRVPPIRTENMEELDFRGRFTGHLLGSLSTMPAMKLSAEDISSLAKAGDISQSTAAQYAALATAPAPRNDVLPPMRDRFIVKPDGDYDWKALDIEMGFGDSSGKYGWWMKACLRENKVPAESTDYPDVVVSYDSANDQALKENPSRCINPEYFLGVLAEKFFNNRPVQDSNGGVETFFMQASERLRECMNTQHDA